MSAPWQDNNEIISKFIKDKKAIVIINNTKEEYKVKKVKDNELIFYNSSNKIKVDKENNTLKFKYNGIDLTLDRK